MAGTGGASFSFVHAADLHLDTPFHGVHAVAPGVADALREASLDAFDAIVDLAIARDAAFLLVAGDVYDGAERGLRAQLRFRAGLERLSVRGIASFVVHGNHDPVESGWSALTSGWPEGTTVFGTGSATIIPVERGGVTIASVQGISYRSPAETENLARRLHRDGTPGVAIGLLHCNVAGSPDSYAPYSPCTLDDLVATGLDYLALGHIHERRILMGEPGRGPWIVYPGNSQARSPRASESGAKGAVVVDVVDGSIAGVEFVACDRIRFGEIELAIDDLADIGAVEDELQALATERLDNAEGRSLVLRARLIGRGEIHRDLARPGSIDDLLRVLREQAPLQQPFIWWDEVHDHSASAIDLDAVRDRGDFASDLLAVAESLVTDPARLATLVERLADSAPRALRGDLSSLLSDATHLGSYAQSATSLALDALFSDQP